MKFFFLLGSINMALAISFGAFGAHYLANKVTEKMLHNWSTAAQYHLIHSLGLLIVGLVIAYGPVHSALFNISGLLILLGIMLFSGSLYALALSGVRMWGIVTPFGGISFILGWLLFLVAVIKKL